MKIKRNSDDDLPSLKILNTYNLVILIISALYDNDKYYPQVFLGECLFKLPK